MAVVFELVVNCGRDEAAVRRAEAIVAGRAVTIRDARLPLAGPFVTRFQGEGDKGYIEFSVVVPAIGHGGPSCSTPFDVRTVTDSEVAGAGAQLYQLLREFPSYLAAAVGWDPEERVDVGELAAELAAGWVIPPGVVLARAVADRLAVAESMEPFTGGYLWVPYTGDPSLWTT